MITHGKLSETTSFAQKIPDVTRTGLAIYAARGLRSGTAEITEVVFTACGRWQCFSRCGKKTVIKTASGSGRRKWPTVHAKFLGKSISSLEIFEDASSLKNNYSAKAHVYACTKHRLSAVYEPPPSKNPSKNPCPY